MKRTNPYLTIVGNKVKQARKSKKINVRQLGALCETDYANLSRFENGQVNMRLLLLKRIAEVLEMDIKELL